MDPASRLFHLHQGNRPIEDYIMDFCGLCHLVAFNDMALKDIFRHGLNEPIRSQLPGGKIHWTLEQYIDFALLLVGSPFTVGIADEGPRNRAVTPIPQTAHVTSAKPQPAHVTSANPKPAHVTSSAPRPAHAMPATPGPVHAMPAHLESAPVMAALLQLAHKRAAISKPVHKKAVIPEPVHKMAAIPKPVHKMAAPSESPAKMAATPEPHPSKIVSFKSHLAMSHPKQI
ncbi:hypothetical protein M9458_048583, partial [Cirrhinus mrigala]